MGKGKEASCAKRTLIGRLDKDTGKLFRPMANANPQKQKPSLNRCFYGATLSFGSIGDKTGLFRFAEMLPEVICQMLSVIYF